MAGYDPEFLGENFKIDIPWINYGVFADVLKQADPVRPAVAARPARALSSSLTSRVRSREPARLG